MKKDREKKVHVLSVSPSLKDPERLSTEFCMEVSFRILYEQGEGDPVFPPSETIAGEDVYSFPAHEFHSLFERDRP